MMWFAFSLLVACAIMLDIYKSNTNGLWALVIILAVTGDKYL